MMSYRTGFTLISPVISGNRLLALGWVNCGHVADVYAIAVWRKQDDVWKRAQRGYDFERLHYAIRMGSVFRVWKGKWISLLGIPALALSRSYDVVKGFVYGTYWVHVNHFLVQIRPHTFIICFFTTQGTVNTTQSLCPHKFVEINVLNLFLSSLADLNYIEHQLAVIPRDWIFQDAIALRDTIVQELCESRGGRPGLSVLTSLLVSVDVKLYWTMLRH